MKRVFAIGKRRVEYTLISARRENVLLQALPGDKIRVYAPNTASLRDMDALVRERLAWIDEMHARLRLESPAPTLDGAKTVLLEGRRVPLTVNPGARNSVALRDGGIVMTTSEADPSAQVAYLKRFYYRLALQRVREALDRWAPTVGLPYGRVAIREQRTRWGSCSSKRNLNFNSKLVLAPPEALQYVVIHELCHLRDFNHSPRFWQEVKSRMPEYEYWKKWLKEHGKDLSFP